MLLVMTDPNSAVASTHVFRRAGIALVLTLAALHPGVGQPAKPRDLSDFSLEELMNLRVTSVAGKEQTLSKTAAAVYVITAEDIRRSGATNIPDLLRLAPGVNVEQIDANSWALSIRGFTDRYANKVLVLIDGRSVYSPMYSGVIWDSVDTPLEDIDRIEVIRGPGGTVWGANAVNGVINILTKSAQLTQGGVVTGGAGSLEKEGFVRYGGALGRRGSYRVFGKHFRRGNSDAAAEGPAFDGWYLSHGGFRTDWSLSERDRFTAQGDFQRTIGGQTMSLVFSNALPLQATINDRMGMSTGNVLGRWTHTRADGSELSWQFYDDYFRRSEQGIRYSHNIIDAAFQHHGRLGARHDLVWGAGARNATITFEPGYSVSIDPPHKTDRLFSAFVQDEVKLSDQIWLTAGTKLEHNDYTGFEWEPSAQLLWTATARQAVWISAARAIRQPNRQDVGVQFDIAIVPTSPFGVVKAIGNPNLAAERLYDFEAGYRAQLGKKLSLDLAVFTGLYRNLTATIPQAGYFTLTPAPPHLVLPLRLENAAHGRSNGIEFFLNSNITRSWRISPGYSMLRLQLEGNSGITNAGTGALAQYNPEHQFQFRSFLNLSSSLEWDHTLTYVSRLHDGNIPGYVRLDSRLARRIGESFEVSVTGRNLLQSRHAEFPDELGLNHTQIERSVFGKVTWRF